MIMSKAVYDSAVGFVENENPPDGVFLPELTRKRILNSTIQLNGTNRAGDGTFYGSGAIVNVNSSGVTILSALHNVGVWAEHVDGWQSMLDKFTDKVKIFFTDKDLTINGTVGKIAKITTAALFGTGNTPTSYYDLLVITSNDNKLKAYAREFVFDSVDDTLKKEAAVIASSYSSLLNVNQYFYVQCGYGKKSDTRTSEGLNKAKPPKVVVYKTLTKSCAEDVELTAGHLHYRRTNPASKSEPAEFYNQEAKAGDPPQYSVFQSAVAFSGRDLNTTAVGDSGGPIYAIDRGSLSKVYLIGVTTGADMMPARLPRKAIFRNAIVTATQPYMASIKSSAT